MVRAIRIYLVEFNTYSGLYTDSKRVWNDTKSKYIDIPLGGLLVSEDELTKVAQFGNGYKSIKFVGNMYLEVNRGNFSMNKDKEIIDSYKKGETPSTVIEQIKKTY